MNTILSTIQSATFDKEKVKNGETVALTVITETGATVTADISALDTTQTEPVKLVESPEIPGTFTADITISEENIAGPSDKVVTITVENVVDNAVTTEVLIELIPPIEFDLTLNAGLNMIALPT